MILLDPYVLAKRLRTLCESGKVDDAVDMLKNSPRDSMNAIVWNTIIWEAMKRQRFQLAYKLYVDMKRRGLAPTTRTYQTMFSGLSRIDNWTSYSQQLSNAKLLYDSFQRHITSLKKHEPDSLDITPAPLAAYIKILADNGQYEALFDILNDLDPIGPFSADLNIYTAMFQAMSNMRRTLSNKGIKAPDSFDAKVASDAKDLWLRLSKGHANRASPRADAVTATTAISALSNGGPGEHKLAFEIAETYLGLSKNPTAGGSGYFPLTAPALGASLKLCNRAAEYRTCIDFLQQVKLRPAADGGLSIIDRPHMEEVLKARYQLAEEGFAKATLQDLQWMMQRENAGHGAHIRPAMSTFNLVFSACWKASDWVSAANTFELMTGYFAMDFRHTLSPESPPKRRSRGQSLLPGAEGMSAMMRTALSTRQLRHIQQCLRMLQHIGIDHIRVKSQPQSVAAPLENQRSSGTRKDAKNNQFYGFKLASALAESIKLLQTFKDEQVLSELAQWRAFAHTCRGVFGSGSGAGDGYKPTKLVAETNSGTVKPRTRL